MRSTLGRDNSTTIAVRVPLSVAAAWSDYQPAHGPAAGRALRRSLILLMQAEPPDEVEAVALLLPRYRASGKIERPPHTRIELRLSTSERAAVTKLAKVAGTTESQWLVALLRAVLLRGVLAPSEELEALKRSTRELAAIGKNLNQIARHLNADPERAPSVPVAMIEGLAHTIAAHRGQVDALVDQTLERWTLLEARLGKERT